jgi:hypothetical protein
MVSFYEIYWHWAIFLKFPSNREKHFPKLHNFLSSNWKIQTHYYFNPWLRQYFIACSFRPSYHHPYILAFFPCFLNFRQSISCAPYPSTYAALFTTILIYYFCLLLDQADICLFSTSNTSSQLPSKGSIKPHPSPKFGRPYFSSIPIVILINISSFTYELQKEQWWQKGLRFPKI